MNLDFLVNMLYVILGILGVFAWCFLCLGIFGACVYLCEKRREKKEVQIHVVHGDGWTRYYINEGKEGWNEEQ